MKRHILFVVCVLFLFSGFIFNAEADLVVTYKLKNVEDIDSMKILLSSDALRLDYTGLPYSMIYKKDGSFFLIDHEKKSFWDVREIISNMESMKREIEKRLAQVPPEQRGMIEGLMKIQMGWQQGSKEVEPCEEPKVIGREVINGIPTSAVDGCKTIEDGKWVTCRYWFAEGEKLGLKKDDFKILEDFMEMQRKAFYSFRQLGTKMGVSFSYHPSVRQMKLPYKLPFVVKAAAVKKGGEGGQVILEDIERTAKLPEKNFLTPKGFQKIEVGILRPMSFVN